MFSLEKSRLCGELTAAFWYVKGAYREAGEGCCFIRTCSKGFKLKEGKFSAVRWWGPGTAYGEGVDTPSLAVFKASWTGPLNLVW